MYQRRSSIKDFDNPFKGILTHTCKLYDFTEEGLLQYSCLATPTIILCPYFKDSEYHNEGEHLILAELKNDAYNINKKL